MLGSTRGHIVYDKQYWLSFRLKKLIEMYCQVVGVLLQACRAGHSAACMAGGDWTRLCGSPRQPCPPILTLVEPKARESGLYRCHITFDSSVIMLNVYMLQFTGEFNGTLLSVN